MLHKLSLAILLLTFGQLSNAQLPFPGNCPEVKGMTDFNLDAYTGIWYEHSKYPFIFEIGKKCIYAKYGNLGNKTVSVLNASINRFSGKPSSIEGYAKVLGPGRLAVVFRPGQSESVPNYVVLKTDYNTYAVVYSCTNFSSIFNTRVVWILTRERKASAETIATAKQVLDENKLSQSFLSDTDQNDCPAVHDLKIFDVSDDVASV